MAPKFETVRRPHRAATAMAVPALLAMATAAWVAVAGWAAPSPELRSAARASELRPAPTTARDDVTVTRCSNAVFLGAAAWGRVVNGSSAPADYRISVSFDGPRAVPLATAEVIVEDVARGATVEWETSGFVDEGVVTHCRVTGVERIPS